MANLKIVSDVATCDVKLDVIHGDARKVNGKEIEMKDDGSPKIIYKEPTGKDIIVYQEFDAVTQQPIQGRTSAYVDPSGKAYQKSEALPFYKVADSDELIPATKNDKTEVFEVRTWDTVENYLDKYQMDRYYQVRPSSGVSKKDFAKALAIQANTVELKKLWSYMYDKKVVGKGVLNITSSGFLPSVGYLRAIKLGDKWTLEMAIFKETKPFIWSEALDWKPTLSESLPKVVKGKHSTAQVEEL